MNAQWFHFVASCSQVFVLNVLLITLSLGDAPRTCWPLAGLGSVAGCSFQTEYRLQVEEDIKPFRDVLMVLLLLVTIGVKLAFW